MRFFARCRIACHKLLRYAQSGKVARIKCIPPYIDMPPVLSCTLWTTVSRIVTSTVLSPTRDVVASSNPSEGMGVWMFFVTSNHT